MHNKYIYLVFTKTGTWLSKIIYTISNMKYTHTSISFDDHFNKMYSFGRTNIDDPFSGGFVEENLYGGLFKRFSSCECLIYKVQVTKAQFEHLQELVNKFDEEKAKYKYNLLGLLGVLLKMPLNRKNYYFCSQFVSEILLKSSVFDCNKDSRLTVPSDLFAIENKTLIYQGLVNECYYIPMVRALEG